MTTQLLVHFLGPASARLFLPKLSAAHILPPAHSRFTHTDAMSGWEGARAEDGTLPIDFARRTGLGGVVERFLAVKK